MTKSFRLAALGAMIALAGCTTIADMAGYDSQTLNAEAAKGYSQVITEANNSGELDISSKTSKRVQAIYQKMLPYAQQANTTGIPFNWELNVIRSDTVNAWAMPGGKMVVYTGLVEDVGLTDDEIAAIMGHEMIHALHEHSKADYGQKILTGIGMDIGGAILQDQTGLSSDTVDMGSSILSEFGIDKPFSRSQESEADRDGLMLMAKSGYNPQAAVTLWQKMAAYGGTSSTPEFMSTHPSDQTRAKDLQAAMPEAMELYAQSAK